MPSRNCWASPFSTGAEGVAGENPGRVSAAPDGASGWRKSGPTAQPASAAAARRSGHGRLPPGALKRVEDTATIARLPVLPVDGNTAPETCGIVGSVGWAWCIPPLQNSKTLVASDYDSARIYDRWREPAAMRAGSLAALSDETLIRAISLAAALHRYAGPTSQGESP